MIKDIDPLSTTQIQDLERELFSLLEDKDRIITNFLLVSNENYELESQFKSNSNFMNRFSIILEKRKNSEQKKDDRIKILKKKVLDRIEAKNSVNNSISDKYSDEIELVKNIWLKNKIDFENEKRGAENLVVKARLELSESEKQIEKIDKDFKEIEKKIEDEKSDTSVYSEMYEKSLSSLRFRLYEVNMTLFKEQENSLKIVNEISELENEF